MENSCKKTRKILGTRTGLVKPNPWKWRIMKNEGGKRLTLFKMTDNITAVADRYILGYRYLISFQLSMTDI